MLLHEILLIIIFQEAGGSGEALPSHETAATMHAAGAGGCCSAACSLHTICRE